MGPSKNGATSGGSLGSQQAIRDDRPAKRGGQELAHDLVRWADVVITNVRVNTLDRWGLDWETLHRVNPGS